MGPQTARPTPPRPQRQLHLPPFDKGDKSRGRADPRPDHRNALAAG